jgi:peroxiredoxin Q/BCP
MQKISPLEEKSEIPKFSTLDSEGKPVSSSNLLGKRYLIYFYPRDNTPGCTAQACGFKENYKFFKNNNIKILGVSGDTIRSHQNFRRKFELPFPLLMDEDNKIAKAFGVWGEKKFMGRVYEGIHRISFLINENGKIEKTFLKVKAKTHPEEVVNRLKGG